MALRLDGRLHGALDGELASARQSAAPASGDAVLSPRLDAGLPALHAPEADKPVWTLEQIVENFQRWDNPWGADVIQYAFPKTSSEPGFIPFTDEQIAATRLVFALLEDIVDLEFRQTSDVNASGTIVFENAQDLGEGIWGIGGGGGAEGGVTVDSEYMSGYWAGSYNLMALAHEIGHALNLPHPGEYTTGWSSTYASEAPYAQDSLQYTIMSYWESEETGAYHSGRYASTFLLHDIAALQAIYGANMTTRPGDSTYGFNITPDVNPAVFDFLRNRGPVVAIWDTGGIDTLDVSEFGTFANISLVPGSFSDIGGNTKALAIAFGTIIENVISSYAADTIGGNDADNLLVGGEGDDIISGGAGDDTLYGGRLDFGAAHATYTDTLIGGTGDDSYYIGSGLDRVQEAANAGTDTLYVRHGNVTLPVNIENLVIEGGSSNGAGNALNNAMTGNSAANRLLGMAGNDTLNGGAGNDVLDGGTGLDRMFGGAGDDAYFVADAGDRVTEGIGAGRDVVYASINFMLGGNLEVLRLMGTALNGIGNALANDLGGNGANNVLRGLDGNDTLSGQGGSDTLDGGTGADLMGGGAGNDAYQVENIGDRVIEAQGAGDDTVYASVNTTLSANVETLILTSAVRGDGSATANTMVGLDIANHLRGFDGNDTLSGGGGNDTLLGGTGDDSLRGGLGSDVIDGGTGVDIADGGEGGDAYYVDASADIVADSGSIGRDIVFASASYTIGSTVEGLRLQGAALNGAGNGFANEITGTSGANRLQGLAGDDTIGGLDGHDTLDGGTGADYMVGGLGDDVYYVDAPGDTARENADAGRDTVHAMMSTVLGANIEILVLDGGDLQGDGNALANTITGTSGANALRGLDGDDALNGGLGTDTLEGGAGRDIVDAGDDDAVDLIRLGPVSDSTGVTRDLVRNMDFNEDRIDLVLANAPTSILTPVTQGSLSAASFDTDLAAALGGGLGAGQAVLFDPNAGDLNVAGHVYLVIDGNGTAGYQAGEDYVLEFLNPTGTLDIGDFV